MSRLRAATAAATIIAALGLAACGGSSAPAPNPEVARVKHLEREARANRAALKEARVERQELAKEAAARHRKQAAAQAKAEAAAQTEAETEAATAPVSEYPPEVKQHFMAGCTAGGMSAGTCECVLGEVEANLSLEQVVALEEGMRANVPPPASFRTWVENCRGY